jgi:putative flippase GtrA
MSRLPGTRGGERQVITTWRRTTRPPDGVRPGTARAPRHGGRGWWPTVAGGAFRRGPVSGRIPHTRSRVAELARFAMTGSVAYLSDLLVFNVLILGAGLASGWAKLISSAVAIGVAFTGSRWFTWRDRRSDRIGREYTLFVVFSVLGSGIQYSCLMVSHHVIGWTSPLADNLSANVVGMGLATAFRFWMFRTRVFPPASVHRRAPVGPPRT